MAIDVDGRIRSPRVIDVLSRLVSERGPPAFLRSDNGPEFVSKALLSWIVAQGINTALIEPGKPWQNAKPATPIAKAQATPDAAYRDPDCVADDAVHYEPVSAPNSLLTGKLTGNFANSGPQQRFPHLINELIQSLAAKFPTQRNREFLQP